MAADAVKLDPLRREAGRALLARTDALGFGAIGAAWVYSRQADRWWFMLVSPMVDTKGPQWLYERLTRVFAKWQLPDGMTPLDIRIVSPDEALYRDLPLRAASAAPDIGTAIKLADATVADVPIDAAFFYRAQPASRRRADPSRRFDRKVRQLMAA
jgi:hypothetical protein